MILVLCMTSNCRCFVDDSISYETAHLGDNLLEKYIFKSKEMSHFKKVFMFPKSKVFFILLIFIFVWFAWFGEVYKCLSINWDTFENDRKEL